MARGQVALCTKTTYELK